MDINFVMSIVTSFFLGMGVAFYIAIWVINHPDWLKDKRTRKK